MAEPNPTSPPPTRGPSNDFDTGFEQLMQHNAVTPYQRSPYHVEDTTYPQSAPSTMYNSPASRPVLLDPYDQRYFNGGSQQYMDISNFGPYGSSNPSMMYPHPSSAYQGMNLAHSNYAASPYQYGSAATPEPSEHGDRNKRTRNGRSPRPKRAAKKTKTEAVGDASISSPLSQLCLDVPVVDVYGKVNRSIEERQDEARKDNKIKRPSNSFMLYRSAYGDRVKALYPQNNHQIISRICGASWKMETPDVVQKFKEYYEMEKENHAKAHPTYKFSPAKASPNRKRRLTGETSDEEDDGSELGDLDGEYRPRGGRRSRPAKTPRTGTPTSYPAPTVNVPYGNYGTALVDTNMNYNPSAWQSTNPGKPMPAPMNPHLPEGQYYQTRVFRRAPNVEDVCIYRNEAPRSQPVASQALIGLPGGSHEELLGMDSGEDSPSPQVDPLLLGLPSQVGDVTHDAEFQDFDQHGLYQSGLQTNGHTSSTQSGADFDPWSEQANDGIPEGDFDWLR
ncbi:MAG: hypothetical protein Q9183_000964 [Haloplaca sp. 2 TL-2023]